MSSKKLEREIGKLKVGEGPDYSPPLELIIENPLGAGRVIFKQTNPAVGATIEVECEQCVYAELHFDILAGRTIEREDMDERRYCGLTGPLRRPRVVFLQRNSDTTWYESPELEQATRNPDFCELCEAGHADFIDGILTEHQIVLDFVDAEVPVTEQEAKEKTESGAMTTIQAWVVFATDRAAFVAEMAKKENQ